MSTSVGLNTRLLDKMRARRVDPTMPIRESREVYKRLAETPAIQYAVGSMQPIDDEYTRNTFAECDRVQAQLADGFHARTLSVGFDHQGSVTNDTHIKAHSDIDLLALETRFEYVEPPKTNESPYPGDPIADLKAIRRTAASKLVAAYPQAKVDQTGSKCLSISGGSLRRKIDVVVAAWEASIAYDREPVKAYRGIRVLDNEAGTAVPNKPFLHNARVEADDLATNGGTRKLIRLLKSLKYDSERPVTLSSYDISALVYNMAKTDKASVPGNDLLLVRNVRDYLRAVSDATDGQRDQLYVPNGTRKVFCSAGATVASVREMLREVTELVSEIEAGLTRSFRKLAEARIAH